MAKGRVKEYSKESGVGIIVDSRTGWQHIISAHSVNLSNGEVLRIGQEVEFDFPGNSNQESAINVRIV